jgi:hypothetical protein
MVDEGRCRPGAVDRGQWMSDGWTHADGGNLPVGAIRLARSRALLAARRGDSTAADAHLAAAEARTVDPFHRALLDATAIAQRLREETGNDAAPHP